MTGPPTGFAAAERALRVVDIAVRRRLDGLLHGEHAGLRPGPGGELDSARPYLAGQDDVRRMDWSVTARTGAPHVRATVAERELETWVLVDGSASMDFGTAVMEKRDLAVAVVAAVAALTDRPGNRLGACLLTGAGPRTRPPRAGRVAARALLRDLLAAPRVEPGPTAAVDLAHGLERWRREHRRPGLRVIVSDFLDTDTDTDTDTGAWALPVRRLAARHEVVAVEVVDRREQALPDVGPLVLLDPESGRRREVRTGDRRLRERYAAAVAAHRAGTAAALRRAGVAHLVLHTDGDWVTDLAVFLASRRRTARRAPSPRPSPSPRSMP
jgi:uncharacterized protein (DUF58 family)